MPCARDNTVTTAKIVISITHKFALVIFSYQDRSDQTDSDSINTEHELIWFVLT